MLFMLCCIAEEFVTPLSTPPSEAEDAVAADTAKHSELVENTTSSLSESAVYDKIYETYDYFAVGLLLCLRLQILVIN